MNNYKSQFNAFSRNSLLFILVHCLFFISSLTCFADNSTSRSPLKVFILYSWHKDMPWQLSFERGLQNGLKEAKEEFELYAEYIDAGRFREAAQHEAFFVYLKNKYSSKPIDVIIGESAPAIVFLNAHPELFPQARRILFQTDEKIDSNNKYMMKNDWTIQLETDFISSIVEMNRVIKPNKIFVIVDTEDGGGKKRLEAFNEGLKAYGQGMETEYLTNFPFDKLLEKVSRLPERSAIFYLLVFSDGKGHSLTPYQAAKIITEHANAPMFSHWESLMGSGILGGYLISGEKAGKIAAHSIMDHVQGQSLTINPKDAFGSYYDWRQLKRWGINRKLLPPDTKILFFEPTLFEKYKLEIIATITFLTLLSVLSLWLLIVNHKLNRTEKALRKNIVLFNKSQAIGNVGFWELDLINNRLTWSDEVYRIFGLCPQEFEATFECFLNAVLPEDRIAVESAYSESVRDRRATYEIEHRIVRCDSNEVRTVTEKCEHEHDTSGRIIRSIGMVQDITQRKRAEEILRDNAIMMNTIFENAAGIMMLVNKELCLVKINREGEFFAGREQQALIGLLGGDVLRCLNSFRGAGCGRNSECTECPVRTRVMYTFKTGKPIYNAESRLIVMKNGTQIPIDFLLSTAQMNMKNQDLILVTILDVTEFKKQEFELLKLRRSVENSPLSIVITDLEGNIEYVNPAFSTITGYTYEESVGQNPRILNSGMHDDTYYKKLWQTVSQGDTWRGEMCNRKKDGSLFWEQVNISPVRSQDGNIANYVAIKEDITERKKMENLREDVERILRHDLKTPLNSIIGFPQLLIQTAQLTDRQKKYCQNIEDAGNNMLKMINLYLNMFKMESGKYNFKHQTFNVIEIVNRVFMDMEPQRNKKNIKFQIRINHESADETHSIKVKGEKILCYTMLSNLIKNAVEASPENQIVFVDILTQSSNVSIQITNQGVVPYEIRNRFFEKYATSGKEKGTGLGAYSAKLMAETQGGKISMETSEEKGTTVTVVLLA